MSYTINVFIDKLFHEMNEKGITYAILRNYQSFPNKPIDTEYFDLDFIVSSKDMSKYADCVKNLSNDMGLVIVKHIVREYVKTFRIASIDSKNNTINSVQLDAHISGQNWHGFFYLKENDIFREKCSYKNIFVVNNFHQNLFNWLDKLLWGGYVKDKYKNEILNSFRKNNVCLRYFLEHVFEKKLSCELLNKINSQNLNGTLSFRKKMIRKLRKFSLVNYPLLTISSIVKFYYFEFMLRVFPTGLFCVFIGVERSFIDNCFNELKTVILGDQHIFRYKKQGRIKWLYFYFKKVFPVVRKGGIAFVMLDEGNIPYKCQKNISAHEPHIDVCKKMLEIGQSKCLITRANLCVK